MPLGKVYPGYEIVKSCKPKYRIDTGISINGTPVYIPDCKSCNPKPSITSGNALFCEKQGYWISPNESPSKKVISHIKEASEIDGNSLIIKIFCLTQYDNKGNPMVFGKITLESKRRNTTIVLPLHLLQEVIEELNNAEILFFYG